MIDRTARDDLASAIECYLSKAIDNAGLESRMLAKRTRDQACEAIADAMLYFSSEFRHHFNAGSAQLHGRQLVSVQRWVALLRSDLEWPITVKPPKSFLKRLLSSLQGVFQTSVPPCLSNQFWPFESQEDIDQNLLRAKA